MRIKRIELSNVRGVAHLDTGQLPEHGVIVIHGGNEAGKSTLVDAVKICLTESHTSGAKNPRDGKGFAQFGAGWLRSTASDEPPEVTVEMEVGQWAFTIFKRFLKRKSARLTVTSSEHKVYQDQEADAKLREILSENLDMNLFGTLFLHQGDLGEAIKAAGVPSLTTALEDATGTTPGAGVAEDTALAQAIEAEYSSYFDKNGKPRKDYAAADKRVKAAEEQVAEAEGEMATLEGYVDGYAAAERSQADAERELPVLREEVDAKKEAAEAAARVAEQVGQLQEARDRAVRDLERAKEDSARVEERHQQLTEARALVEELNPQVAAAVAEAEAESEARRTRAAALEEAKQAQVSARSQVRACRTLVHAVEGHRAAAKLAERIAELESLEKEVSAAQEAAAARGTVIGDAEVTRAEQAAAELALATSLREQAAAKLVFTSPAAMTLVVDGEDVELPAGEEVPVALADSTELRIGQVSARFTAGSGSATSADPRAREEAAELALTELLEAYGCDDVDAVRAKRDAHRQVGDRLARARADFQAALRGDDLGDLRAQLKALEAQLTTLQEDVPELGQDIDADQLREELAAAEASAEAAEEAVETARLSLDSLSGQPAEMELIRLRQQLLGAEDNAKRAEADWEQLEKAGAAEATTRSLEAAEEEARLAAERVAQAEQELAAADPDLAQKLYEGAAEGLRSLEQRLSEAKTQQLRLSSYIEQAQGVAENLVKARTELEAAQSHWESMHRRALAAQRLQEVMTFHRDAARERYAAPLAARLEELGKVVYGPGVRFDLDEELQVTSRTRDGATVDLTDLSGGAKEQLALMTRFAIADMSATGEEGVVPIVVDDALGSTDSRRLELMSTLFADAGKHGQVIVLTCVPERYSRIPGRVERDIEELKRA